MSNNSNNVVYDSWEDACGDDVSTVSPNHIVNNISSKEQISVDVVVYDNHDTDDENLSVVSEDETIEEPSNLNSDCHCSWVVVEEQYEHWQIVKSKNDIRQENIRKKGLDLLSNPKKMEEKLRGTRLCNSVIDGTKCRYGAKCYYAHGIDKLIKKPCVFKQSCKFVQFSQGVYTNKPNKYMQVCHCWHPYETEKNYSKRMGVGNKEEKSKPTKINL
jgi:hypothetical protein